MKINLQRYLRPQSCLRHISSNKQADTQIKPFRITRYYYGGDNTSAAKHSTCFEQQMSFKYHACWCFNIVGDNGTSWSVLMTNLSPPNTRGWQIWGAVKVPQLCHTHAWVLKYQHMPTNGTRNVAQENSIKLLGEDMCRRLLTEVVIWFAEDVLGILYRSLVFIL